MRNPASQPAAAALAPGMPLLPLALLLTVGSLWGLSFSFAKAAANDGISALGYGFWQTTGAGSALLVLCICRRELPRLDRAHLTYFLISGLLSLAAPNLILMLVIGHVPAGVAAIIITTVPLLTYALALAMRLEHFMTMRALGLIVGFLGALVLILPKASLPQPGMAGWVAFGFLAPVFYAVGNVYVALRRPPSGAFPLSVGMLAGAAFWQAPAVIATGSFEPLTLPFSFGEWGVIGQIAVTSLATIMYLEILRRAGPVFFSQVAYVVTLTAILWAMAIFGERHSLWVWAAGALIILGVAMVNFRSPKTGIRNEKG